MVLTVKASKYGKAQTANPSKERKVNVRTSHWSVDQPPGTGGEGGGVGRGRGRGKGGGVGTREQKPALPYDLPRLEAQVQPIAVLGSRFVLIGSAGIQGIENLWLEFSQVKSQQERKPITPGLGARPRPIRRHQHVTHRQHKARSSSET